LTPNSMIEASLEESRRKGLGRTLDQRSLVAMHPMYQFSAAVDSAEQR
jgi:hypothetical protein